MLASTQACVDFLVNLADANKKGATITRIIMSLTVRPALENVQSEIYFGIAAVNADAAAALVFPDPDVETDNVRWLVRGGGPNESNADTLFSSWRHYEFDLRAQLRYRSEQEETHFILNQNAGGDMFFWLMTRILVKHP